MYDDLAVAPIVKTVTVPCSVDRAFDLFTSRIAQWWPLPTHSVGGDDAASVEMQCAAGGEIVEHLADGSREVWGTINEWVPPERLTFSWHPGTPPGEATTVEVTFRGADDNTTVTLTHSGWQKRPDGERAHYGYDTGWDVVLGCLTQFLQPSEHVAASEHA